MEDNYRRLAGPSYKVKVQSMTSNSKPYVTENAEFVQRYNVQAPFGAGCFISFQVCVQNIVCSK